MKRFQSWTHRGGGGVPILDYHWLSRILDYPRRQDFLVLDLVGLLDNIDLVDLVFWLILLLFIV